MSDTPETVICPKCGTENAAWVSTCRKCSHTLTAQGGPQSAHESQSAPAARPASAWGIIIGLVAAGGLAYVVVDLVATESRISEYQELSAIQITQLYTQASFWLLAVVALLLVALLLVVSTR